MHGTPKARYIGEFLSVLLLWISLSAAAQSSAPSVNPTSTPYPRFTGHNADWIPQITTINGIDMAFVPPGCFTMGSDDVFLAPPPHRQCIDQPYYIGVTEVTNAQYAACVDAGACTPPTDQRQYQYPSYADYPVVWITWFQAHDFAAWWGGRLPTEREWEYAARGVDSWAYPWGDQWDAARLNFCDRLCLFDWRDSGVNDGYYELAPVEQFSTGSSWVGSLNMAGNAYEWVSSLYRDYPYEANDGREADTGDRIDVYRSLRGGAWLSLDISTYSAFRDSGDPGASNNFLGFRLAHS